MGARGVRRPWRRSVPESGRGIWGHRPFGVARPGLPATAMPPLLWDRLFGTYYDRPERPAKPVPSLSKGAPPMPPQQAGLAGTLLFNLGYTEKWRAFPLGEGAVGRRRDGASARARPQVGTCGRERRRRSLKVTAKIQRLASEAERRARRQPARLSLSANRSTVGEVPGAAALVQRRAVSLR